MFFPEAQVRIYLDGEPVSMRLSYDGLYALARHRMQLDPLACRLFAFINRRAIRIKILYFDRSGWCLWSKRFERGRPVSNREATTLPRLCRLCQLHATSRPDACAVLGARPQGSVRSA